MYQITMEQVGDGNGGGVGGSCSNKTICIFTRKEDGTGINEAYRKYLFNSLIWREFIADWTGNVTVDLWVCRGTWFQTKAF